MTQYDKVNVKSSYSQLNEWRYAVRDQIIVTLRMAINMFDGDSLPHELLLTTRQRTKLRNAFNNNTSADIKLSKSQLSKITKSGNFLGGLFSKIADSLMKLAVH